MVSAVEEWDVGWDVCSAESAAVAREAVVEAREAAAASASAASRRRFASSAACAESRMELYDDPHILRATTSKRRKLENSKTRKLENSKTARCEDHVDQQWMMMGSLGWEDGGEKALFVVDELDVYSQAGRGGGGRVCGGCGGADGGECDVGGCVVGRGVGGERDVASGGGRAEHGVAPGRRLCSCRCRTSAPLSGFWGRQGWDGWSAHRCEGCVGVWVGWGGVGGNKKVECQW